MDEKIRLDLNNPEFQRTLFALGKMEQSAVLSTLKKLSLMTWEQCYRDAGLKWEAIYSRTGPDGNKLYSFRIGKGFRGVGYRDEERLRLLALHTDHDSTYGKK